MPCGCMGLRTRSLPTRMPQASSFVHAWPAVFALDLGVDGTDVGQQGFVAVTPARATLN